MVSLRWVGAAAGADEGHAVDGASAGCSSYLPAGSVIVSPTLAWEQDRSGPRCSSGCRDDRAGRGDDRVEELPQPRARGRTRAGRPGNERIRFIANSLSIGVARGRPCAVQDRVRSQNARQRAPRPDGGDFAASAARPLSDADSPLSKPTTRFVLIWNESSPNRPRSRPRGPAMVSGGRAPRMKPRKLTDPALRVYMFELFESWGHLDRRRAALRRHRARRVARRAR